MNWLRSLLAPSRAMVATPVSVPVGADLILSIDHATQEDAMALIGAVQAQFPASRIHLLIGFGSVHVSGGQGSGEAEDASHQAKQEIAIEQDAAHARAQTEQLGQQRNIVLLRHCAGGRVVAVSVPPKQQGNSSSQAVFHSHPDGCAPQQRKEIGGLT